MKNLAFSLTFLDVSHKFKYQSREGGFMEIEKFLEIAKKLSRKKKDKGIELERFKRLYERFHLINRAYLDRESFEQAQNSILSMAESIVNTIKYLEDEITRLRNKGRKQPFEEIELAEMQKVQRRNDLLIKEFMEKQPI